MGKVFQFSARGMRGQFRPSLGDPGGEVSIIKLGSIKFEGDITGPQSLIPLKTDRIVVRNISMMSPHTVNLEGRDQRRSNEE